MDNLSLIIAFWISGKAYARACADKAIGGLSTGISWKGAVDYYAGLPTTANVGDAYTVRYSGTSGNNGLGAEYAWGPCDGKNQWIRISPPVSITIDGMTETTTTD